MSLVGIDLGTSAIKIVAYTVDGTVLADAHRTIPAHRPQPGHWEVDVNQSRTAFREALREVTARTEVKRDPPAAISFSSSGREVFPVAADGTPLGPCLMTADTRGDDVAAQVAALHPPAHWFDVAGHVPRRMDPVCRALWWHKVHPAIVAQARWFMNWHEYYSFLLSGHPVVDWGDAGTWAVYDLATGNWSDSRISETGIDRDWLPDVQPNGTPIGRILPRAASEYGLPSDTLVVTGAYDTFAASVGSGAIDPGVVSLSCGTWHSLNLAVKLGWDPKLADVGVSVLPHPGPTGFGILLTNPNGMSVIDWARELVGLSIPGLEEGLAAAGPGPGPVDADAMLTPLPHVDSDPRTGGALTRLTLASTAVDIVRSLLEAIACHFANVIDSLGECGVNPTRVRATGGGSKLAWWLQLKADLIGLPIEVVGQAEPGAFGAAILAGIGIGELDSVSSAVTHLVDVSRRFEPDLERGARYAPVRERISMLDG